MEEMSKAVEQLLRFQTIVKLVEQCPGISREELLGKVADELASYVSRDYSDSTLTRDLNELRKFCGIGIKNQKGGYQIVDKRSSLVDIYAVGDTLDLFAALNGEAQLRNFIFPELGIAKGREHLPTIVNAIRERKRVTFHYHKYQPNAHDTNRTIAPYALKEFRGRWYVIGADAKNAVKTYSLDRISKLELLSDLFDRDKAFDIVEKFANSYGIYASDDKEVEEIILSFDLEDGNYLESRPLHPSQKIVSRDAQRITLSVRLAITPDFIKELLSRAWSIEIISPLTLRHHYVELLREALERNR